MVKKTDDVEFDEVDLDNIDFNVGDGLEDDMSFDMKDDRDPVTVLKDSAKKTLNEKMFDTSWLRQLMGMALPKGYSLALNAYDDASNVIKDVYKDNKSELAPYLQSLNRKVNESNPTLKRFIPKFIRDALEETEESSGYSSSSEDPLTSNIKGLDELFKMQALQNAENRMKDAQGEIVEKRRFASEFGVLQELSRGIQRLVAYQDNILINYQRKHLEINYRQFDVSSKLLASTVKYHDDTRGMLESIMKNTGLPDWVKMHNTEVLKQRLQQRMADMAANSVGGWVGKYFQTFGDNVKQFAGSAVDALGMLGQAEQTGLTKTQFAGEVAGAFAGEWVADRGKAIAESIIAELSPYLKMVPGLETGGRKLQDTLTDLPLKMNRLAQQEDDTTTMWGMVKQALRSLLPQYRPSNTINGLGYEGVDKPAMFDELFHKTVIQIIPGYLASIDKWVRTLATGEEQEEAAYSLYTGGFVNRSVLDEQHVRMGLKAGVGDVIKTDVERMMRSIGSEDTDEDGKPLLSDAAKKAVRKRLMANMANGFEFDPAEYIKPTTWTGVNEDDAEQIIELFAEKFGLGIQGNQYIFTDEIENRKSSVSEIFSDTVKRMPNFAGRMDVLSNTIGRDVWRRMGLSKYDGRKDDIVDLEALYDLLLNSDQPVDEKTLDARGAETDRTKASDGPLSLDEIAKRVTERKRLIFEERKRQQDLERGSVDSEQIDVLGRTSGQLSLERLAGGRPAGTPSSAEAAALEQLHYEINPVVEFPDELMVKDLETHLRLDSLIESIGAQTGVLDHILAAIPLAGSGVGTPETGGEGEDEQETPKPKFGTKEWFRSLPGRAIDGVKKLPGALTRLTGKGLWKGIRGYGSFVGKTYGAMFGAAGMLGKGAWSAAKYPFTSRLKVGAMDVFVIGETEPALTAKRIRRGEYVDVNTKKVISSIKDITGPVMAYGETVEQVLSQEDFDKGLVNGEGNSLATLVGRAGGSAVAGAASLLYRYTKGSYGLMGWMAKKTFGLVSNQFKQFDAYFPGDKEPRIRSKLMKKGYYRDEDGEPIFSLEDIDGPVYDIEGNEVISQEEIDQYKTLYTRNGSVLFTIGRGFGSAGAWAGDMAWKGVKAYGKFVGKVYKGIWDIGSSIVKKPFSWIAGKFGKTSAVSGATEGTSEYHQISLALGGEQLKVQKEILATMKAQFAEDDPDKWDLDGDGTRDNSWAAKMKSKATGKKEKVTAAAMGFEELISEIKNLGDRLEDQFEDLADTVEESGEDGLLDQAADLSDIFGSREERRDGKRRRGRRSGRGRGGRPTPPPKKGFLAKSLKLAKDWGGYVTAGAVTAYQYGKPAGNMVLNAVKNPYVIGAMTVGASTYGIYNWVADYTASKFPFLNLRMAQYGVDAFDEEQTKSILALEALVIPGVKVTGNGASIDPKGFDPEEVFRIFGVDKDSDRSAVLLHWLATRFRPVFLAHCSASTKLNGKIDLSAIDKSANSQDKAFYLSLVDIRGMGSVYNDTEISPFEDELDMDAGDVEDAVKLIKSLLEKDGKANEDWKKAAVLNDTAKQAVQHYKDKTKLTVSSKGVSAEEATKVDELLLGGLSNVEGRIDQRFTESIKHPTLDLATAVRYKTYGLKSFSIAKVEALSKLEALFWDQIRYNGTVSAYIDGDYTRLEFQAVTIIKPIDYEKELEVKHWLRYRFLPTLLQYAISGRKRYNGPARNIHRSLTPTTLRAALEETANTTVRVGYSDMSVWAITKSPWSDEAVETSPGSVKIYLDSLPSEVAGPLSVDGLKARSQTGEASKTFAEKVTNLSQGAGYNGLGKVTGGSGSVIDNMTDIYTKAATGSGSPTFSVPTMGQGDGSLLGAGGAVNAGQEVKHPGGGTGGDINQIPEVKGSGWENVKDTILAAAKMMGFDPAIAATIAGVESTWNPNANVKGGATSAKGLYQFVNGTWKMMLERYGKKYGIAANTPPSDGRANTILGIQYLIDNFNYLKKKIGKVTDTSLYMAHFLGPGGAARFLSAPHTASAQQVVEPKSLSANPSIFRQGGGYKSVGQVLRDFEVKMANIRKVHGLGGAPSPLMAPSLPTPGNDGQAATPTSEAAAAGVPGASSKETAIPATLAPMDSAATTAPKASIQDVAMKAAASATGLAAGNTSNGPIGVMAPVKDAPTTPTATPEVPLPTPTQSATEAATTTSRETASAEMAINTQGIESLLDKQLGVSVSMDGTLKQIREELSRLSAQMGSPRPQMASSQSSNQPEQQDPIPRNPLNTRRSNPVT